MQIKTVKREPAAHTNRAKVYQAVKDLDDHGRKPTKEAVADMTGLAPASVHDAFDALYDCGLIRRVYDGVWEPVDQTPDRIISASALPQGRVKIEIGDDIVTIGPREHLALAKLLVGVLMAFRIG